jgi:photosystem II stability/assembly factor-like uncharacterized protein
MKTQLTIYFAFFLSINCLHAQPTSWQTRGMGGGGALFSPSINPANPQEMYIGCDMTELYHSTDQGTTWKEKHFLNIQGGLFSEVQFTRSPTIRYCVNHAAKDYVDRLRPFKSDDDGATWYPLIAPIQEGAGVLRLFADYNSPSRIVLADYNQVFFSVNGGGNFTRIYNTPLNTDDNHIAGVCFDGTNIYICCAGGIYQSTNNGATWSWMTTTGFPSTDRILSFTWAKTGTALKFVCLTATRVWAGVRIGSTYWDEMLGLFTMSNADGVWKTQTAGINQAGGDFVAWLGMAQNDTSTVYAAGGNHYEMPIVMKSVNSGAWQHCFKHTNNENITTGWAGQHGDAHWDYGSAPQGFQVCPTNPNIVVTTDLGFAHITTDGGANWRQIYLDSHDQNPPNIETPRKKIYHTSGIENTSSWHLAWFDAQTMMASFSDIRGTQSADAGASWRVVDIVENTTYLAFKHADNKVYVATSNIHDLYQSTGIYDQRIDAGGGKIYYSSNNGTTFSVLHDFGHPVVWITADPTTPSVLYAAVVHSDPSIGGVYKTSNLQNGTSATWTKLPNPSRTNGHIFNIHVLKNGDLVCTFSARLPTVGSKFEAASGVFYYSQSSQTWADRSHSNMRFWTKDITIDPADATESTWYASVFQGWGDYAMQGTGGLYRTRDKGLTWARIVSEFRINAATVHPQNPNLMYFSTETNGLWYSTNANDASPTFNQVTSYPFRQPMRVFFNPYKPQEVWVTSFGNGLKVGTDPSIVVLPLELLDFQGFAEPKGNRLTWQTAHEVNVSHFVVEKSFDGKVFEAIDEVKAKGSKAAYTYIDTKTSSRIETSTTLMAYYRLRQMDNDGKETLSKIISISQNKLAKLKVYPSVSTGILTIETSETGDYQIFNLLGQQILSGHLSPQIDVSALPQGTYFLKVGVEQAKFVKP